MKIDHKQMILSFLLRCLYLTLVLGVKNFSNNFRNIKCVIIIGYFPVQCLLGPKLLILHLGPVMPF